jgi:hypothetical protein
MLKKSIYLALAGVLICLTGCAVTPTELRNTTPDHRAMFTMQQNYQAAYRAILERQRACEQAGMITASVVVQGDLFTDLQSGTITTALHGGLGVQTMTVIDLKAAGDQATDVVIATAQPAARYAAGIQRWLAGSRECNV